MQKPWPNLCAHDTMLNREEKESTFYKSLYKIQWVLQELYKQKTRRKSDEPNKL